MTRTPRRRNLQARIRFISTLCIGALVLAACGGDSSSGEDPTTTAGPTTTAAADDSTTTAASPTSEVSEPAGDAWSKVVAAAEDEDSAIIYTSKVDDWAAAVSATIEGQTGLPIEFAQRAPTGPLLERLAGEIRANALQADALVLAEHQVWNDQPDWFIDLADAGLPNFEAYPERAKHPSGKCVDISYGVTGITYNTDLVPSDMAPETWADLADPFWDGQMAMIDIASSGFAYIGWGVAMEDALGVEYLEALASHEPDLFDSASPASEQAAAGAYAVVAPSFPGNSTSLRREGAPIEFVWPSDAQVGVETCAGILADAPNPNAAKVMLNALMTPEVLAAACATDEGSWPLEGDDCTPLSPEFVSTGELIELGALDADHTAMIFEALGLD